MDVVRVGKDEGDLVGSFAKKIELDEMLLAGAKTPREQITALEKFREDFYIPEYIGEKNTAQKVYQRVKDHDELLGLPTFIVFDDGKIKVNPKIAERIDRSARDAKDEELLSKHSSDFSKETHSWHPNGDPSAPVQSAIKEDAEDIAGGKLDRVKKDLLAIWLYTGTPGVWAFANQLNKQFQKTNPDMRFVVDSVSRGGPDFTEKNPLTTFKVLKGDVEEARGSVY